MRRIGEADLVITLLKHWLYFKIKRSASLVIADSAVPFPLPDRWTNDDKSMSQQPKFLIVMQATYADIQATPKNGCQIESSTDKSWANLNLMGSSNFTMREDFDVINRARAEFDPKTDKKYSFSKELLIGESIVNGENPYLLRKFNSGKITYDFEESKKIEENYKNAIKNAFQRESLNQSVLEQAGISKEQLQKAIASGSDTYSMFFEHLQKLTNGQPLINSPEIFYQNQTLKQDYFLQAPYPIFIKSANGDSQGFIIAGVAFRYNKGSQISVFSPFFAKQPYKLWKLAQAQVLQGYYNDFHVRIHLGILHFTTNQYNVPIYNSLRRIDMQSRSYLNLQNFLKHSYTFFNEGLEGINVSAQATLINPEPSYSLLNKVFNYSQEKAFETMANYSNQLNIAEFTPEALLARNGLTRKDASVFDQVQLDIKLTSILAQYIQGVYNVYEIDSVSEIVLKEIQNQTPKMIMGGAKTSRKAPQNGKQLLQYFQNLAFAWVCYHAHTWTTVPYGQYFSLRPSMLKKTVPTMPQQWQAIQQGSQLPHPKVMMSALQLIGGVCAKDPSNFIIDKLKRHLLSAGYAELTAKTEVQRMQNENLMAVLNKAIRQLNEFGSEVQQTNSRRAKLKQPNITWMNPTFMQASLNI